jgi:hypothetical protein
MQILIYASEAISAICFGWYGLACFFSTSMVAEFDRWRVPTLRILTGGLQVAAALGILLGHFFYRPILILSAGGLAAMMFCALLARVRIKDKVTNAIPAFSLMLLNIFIVVSELKQS